MKVSIYLFCALFCASLATTAAPSKETESLHLNWIDKTIKPADNFYRYANGQWQKQHPIPPQYASWGTFYILQEKVQKLIHQMLIEASKNTAAPKNSELQKIGDFYFSGMDVSLINQVKASPLDSEFQKIAAMKTKKDLEEEIIHLHQMGIGVCFNFGSMQDFKNSEEMIGAAMQGGLGLPDRDYYLKDDKKFKDIRDTYLKHIARVFELLGDKPPIAAQEAQVVMQLEKSMAQASLSQIEQRDPHAIYHMKTLAELEQATPHFTWATYFKGIGYPSIDRINLGMPLFFKHFNTLLEQTALEDWKIYLRWHLIEAFSPYLSDPFVEEHFKMTSALSGTKQLLPRWQRVVNVENAALGFAIGKMYVDKYFPPSSKEAVLDIVHNIREVLHQELTTLTWMSPETKKAALEKLNMMGERVGYPSKWWDYSSLMVDRGPFVLNVLRANIFLTKRDLDKIGKPVDRTEWAMTPQTINAYYDASMNNINLPAGILQSPFFDPSAPAAVNYGGIGFVIGHEMTHGFDDEGSQFDGHGNLKNWWTEKDSKKFKEATQCIADQYSNYKVIGGFPVQGKLVVGEATADLGGLIIAYKAFKRSKAYSASKTIQGFTPEMQFFLSVAHVWATNMREAQLRHLVTVDPHPPAEFRVNGTLANMLAFQQAYALPKNSAMLSKTPCVVW